MARNSGGLTALHAAAYAGSVPIATLLLGQGACSTIRQQGRRHAADGGGRGQSLELAELFIAKGADVNHAEIHGYLPISRAVYKGNSDIVRLYKRHGAVCPSAKSSGARLASAVLEIGQ